MFTKPNKYIQIEGYKVLGEFYANFSNLTKNKEILKPAFQVDKQSVNYSELIPGFISNNKFYKCPLPVFYVEIISISEEKSYTPSRLHKIIKIELNIYDKEFNNFINFTTTKKESSISFMLINKLVNNLNKYIVSGNDIKLLNINSEELFHNQKRDLFFVRNIVHKMDFDFYENSQNRPGRDDRFWNELEIRNLPANNYLNKLFISVFKKLSLFSEITDYGILLINIKGIGVSNDYNSSFGRRKFENGEYSKNYIIESILMYLAIEYNDETYHLESMKKNNSLQHRI
jgi:hypothetical protein